MKTSLPRLLPKVGDRVQIPAVARAARVAEVLATVRFFGPTKFANGDWAGVELDQPLGSCNGEKGGVKYFECADDHGLFVKASVLRRMLPDRPHPSRTRSPKRAGSPGRSAGVSPRRTGLSPRKSGVSPLSSKKTPSKRRSGKDSSSESIEAKADDADSAVDDKGAEKKESIKWLHKGNQGAVDKVYTVPSRSGRSGSRSAGTSPRRRRSNSPGNRKSRVPLSPSSDTDGSSPRRPRSKSPSASGSMADEIVTLIPSISDDSRLLAHTEVSQKKTPMGVEQDSARDEEERKRIEEDANRKREERVRLREEALQKLHRPPPDAGPTEIVQCSICERSILVELFDGHVQNCMRKHVKLEELRLTGHTPLAARLVKESFLCLESLVIPEAYVRHRKKHNLFTRLDRCETKRALLGAQYAVVDGLTGGTHVSFESKEFRGSYLRFMDQNLRLDAVDDKSTSGVKREASFRVRPALYEPAVEKAFSFESAAKKGYYICSFGKTVTMQKDTGEPTFGKRASWRMVRPFFIEQYFYDDDEHHVDIGDALVLPPAMSKLNSLRKVRDVVLTPRGIRPKSIVRAGSVGSFESQASIQSAATDPDFETRYQEELEAELDYTDD